MQQQPIDLKTDYPFALYDSLGGLINNLIPTALVIAGILVLFYLIFGAFKLLSSGGDKQAVQGARDMIVHAIIGLFGLLVLFLVVRFIPEFFHLNIQIIK